MQMDGSFLIEADRETVWAALNDPEILRNAIPGCEEIEKLSDTEMQATIKSKVGPISVTFKGKVTLSDLVPPQSYNISGEGSGGRAGSAKGTAAVKLSEEGTGTRLEYDVNVKVTGKLAQLGSKLIDLTAKKLSEQFFKEFAVLAGAKSM